MRRRWIILGALAVVALVLFLAVAGYLGNLLGGSGDPECSDLPRRTIAQKALDDHAHLVSKVSDVGPGVQVSVTTPCPDPDAALVVVRVVDASQESRVREILSDGQGLGVPFVVQRP